MPSAHTATLLMQTRNSKLRLAEEALSIVLQTPVALSTSTALAEFKGLSPLTAAQVAYVAGGYACLSSLWTQVYPSSLREFQDVRALVSVDLECGLDPTP